MINHLEPPQMQPPPTAADLYKIWMDLSRRRRADLRLVIIRRRRILTMWDMLGGSIQRRRIEIQPEKSTLLIILNESRKSPHS